MSASRYHGISLCGMYQVVRPLARKRSSIRVRAHALDKAIEFAMLTCVGWFNNRLLLEPTGNIRLAEVVARFYS